MREDYVECPELSGKTIRTLRIYRDTSDGTEIQIDLSDGTSFSCCFCSKPVVEAALIRSGAGEPELLHKYDLK